MSKLLKNIRLLFLVFMLGISSLQLAVAASSSLLEQADSQCPISHHEDAMVTDNGVPSHDCGQTDLSTNDCNSHICSDSSCVSGVMTTVAASSLKTPLPIAGKVISPDHKLVGKLSHPLYRPPRV